MIEDLNNSPGTFRKAGFQRTAGARTKVVEMRKSFGMIDRGFVFISLIPVVDFLTKKVVF